MEKKERDRADYLRNREKRLAQMRERIGKLRAAKLCVQCGAPRADHSVSRCKKCLEAVRVLMQTKKPRKTRK